MIPLILISGMMCDGRMWGNLPDRLPCPVRHHIPTSTDNMAGLAAAALADARPRFALAGLSMGGILAIEVLRHAPDRGKRLVLMATLMPQSSFAVIPGARHLPPLEGPAQTLTELLTWLGTAK